VSAPNGSEPFEDFPPPPRSVDPFRSSPASSVFRIQYFPWSLFSDVFSPLLAFFFSCSESSRGVDLVRHPPSFHFLFRAKPKTERYLPSVLKANLDGKMDDLDPLPPGQAVVGQRLLLFPVPPTKCTRAFSSIQGRPFSELPLSSVSRFLKFLCQPSAVYVPRGLSGSLFVFSG